MSRNARENEYYLRFKTEAKIVTLKSESSKIKVIKWRGQVFKSKSYVEVFEKIKVDYLKE